MTSNYVIKKRAYYNYLHVAAVAIVFVIVLLIAIFMHDLTLSRIVFRGTSPRMSLIIIIV